MWVNIPTAGKRGRKLRVAPESSDLSSVWLNKSEITDYLRKAKVYMIYLSKRFFFIYKKEPHSCGSLIFYLVGAARFELTASCTRNKRATKLRHAPTFLLLFISNVCNYTILFFVCQQNFYYPCVTTRILVTWKASAIAGNISRSIFVRCSSLSATSIIRVSA